ncbi:helix-turn-helix domain-containing protein [Streptomyces cacaoi]|uniref:helix-turn-helix domain-containing protein n=1 Tax=Streptomyces cacaoi TaxID=1898 RepID=UPI0037485696
MAGLVGRSTDWLAKIERGRRKPPRIDMLAGLPRILRVPLGDLLGQTVLREDETQEDDVPAVCAHDPAATVAPALRPRGR